MASRTPPLRETDIHHPDTVSWTVRVDGADPRPWLQAAPVCGLLRDYQMLHLGVWRTADPFEVVRTKLGGSYFLATLEGEGQVWIDGRWARCRAGEAFLLAPGTLNAFRATAGRGWEYCWVRYRENPGQRPVATSHSPVLGACDARPLRHAVLGLYHACLRETAPAHAGVWLQLIHSEVLRFAQPPAPDVRIRRLWDAVSADLAGDWTSAAMARVAKVGEKQLERLCRRELGRTPRQHLIWLRMRRAAELLQGRSRKIESIAREVGYHNPFVFSSTFKRCLGWSPSEYPRPS